MKQKLKVGDRIKFTLNEKNASFVIGIITDFPKRTDKGNKTVLTILIEELSKNHMESLKEGDKLVFWFTPEEHNKLKVLN